VTLDTTSPNIVVRFLRAPVDDAEFERYLWRLDALYRQKKAMTLTFDTTQLVGMIPVKHFKRQAEFMRAQNDQSEKYVRRVAVYIASSVVRGIVNLLLTLKPPVVKVRLFGQQEWPALVDWIQQEWLVSPPINQRTY